MRQHAAILLYALRYALTRAADGGAADDVRNEIRHQWQAGNLYPAELETLAQEITNTDDRADLKPWADFVGWAQTELA